MIYNNFSHGDSEIWKLRIELVKYFIRYASENGHLEVVYIYFNDQYES